MHDDELLMKQRNSRKLASAIHQKGLNQTEHNLQPTRNAFGLVLIVNCSQNMASSDSQYSNHGLLLSYAVQKV